MKTIKEIEVVLGRLSLSELEYVRDLIADRIEDHLEVTPEAQERIERSHREVHHQFAPH